MIKNCPLHPATNHRWVLGVTASLQCLASLDLNIHSMNFLQFTNAQPYPE